MKLLIREAFGYGAVSGCALLVDIGTLWALVHFLSWGYLWAATASFLVGAIVAYELSVRLVFRHRRVSDRRAEFAGFVAVGTAGLAVNAIVLYLLVRFFGVYYLAAKCVAAGFTFVCNFFVRRQLLFVRPLPA